MVTEYLKWSVANDGAKGCNGLPQPACPIVFLASVNGKGKYSFSCHFPAGSKILMLGGFNLCWTDAEEKTSVADLPKQCSPSSLAPVTRARATIDGVPINIRQYLVTSSIVKASLPKGNAFGIEEPSTSFLDPGWFPLLRPLAPGKHTLRGIIDIKNYGTIDVTYRIMITE